MDVGASDARFKDGWFGGTMSAVNFKINNTQGSDGQVLTSTGSGVAWEAVTAVFTGGTVANATTFSSDVTFSGDNYHLMWDRSANALEFWDNAKLTFGDPGGTPDLELYHDGSNSYIKDVGTGNLLISSNGASVQINKGTTENMAEFITDGAVKLYYDSAKKFETIGDGVAVPAAAGVYFDGGAHTYIKETSADVLKIFVGSDGEHVAFSGGNATFAGDVKIPRYLYHDGDTNTYLEFSAADNLKLYAGGKIYFHAHDNGSLYLSSNNTTALTFDTSQNATFAGSITTTFVTSSTGGQFNGGNLTISSSTNRSIILDYTSGSGGYTWASFKQSGTEQFRIFGSYDDDYLSFYNDQTSAHQLMLNANGSTTFGGNIRTTADIGRDDHNRIMFSTDDNLIYRVADTHRFKMISDAFAPYADSSYDLGTSSLYFRHGYIDAITTTGNVIVGGDLQVNGTTTTVNQTNLDVSDNVIGLNRGAGSNTNDSGIIIERGSTGDNAAILWDETADKFAFGTTQDTPSVTGNSVGESDWTYGDAILRHLTMQGVLGVYAGAGNNVASLTWAGSDSGQLYLKEGGSTSIL